MVRVHLGFEPLDFKCVMTTFEGLLRQGSDPVARVPGVDLVDHVRHHQVGFGGHGDFVVLVE